MLKINCRWVSTYRSAVSSLDERKEVMSMANLPRLALDEVRREIMDYCDGLWDYEV